MILNVDVVSDFVCPWCRLGGARLSQAVAHFAVQRPDITVRVNWLPYQLNPDMPLSGKPYRAFLSDKFGGEHKVAQMQAELVEAGAVDGVAFDFDRIEKRPNTLKAHRLAYRAQSSGYKAERVAQLIDALFGAYFLQGLDIGDDDVLADLAAGCGDKRDAVLAYLQSGQDVDAVTRMARRVREQGVESVPFFIVDRRLGISGAQSTAVMGAVLLQAVDGKTAS